MADQVLEELIQIKKLLVKAMLATASPRRRSRRPWARIRVT